MILIVATVALVLFLTVGADKGKSPLFLYLVVAPEEWKESQQEGRMMLSSFHDAFIHLSTEEQVPKITDKFWKGKEFVLLKIDPKKIQGRLQYEKNPGGNTRYFHLYDGVIPVDAVVEIKKGG